MPQTRFRRSRIAAASCVTSVKRAAALVAEQRQAAAVAGGFEAFREEPGDVGIEVVDCPEVAPDEQIDILIAVVIEGDRGDGVPVVFRPVAAVTSWKRRQPVNGRDGASTNRPRGGPHCRRRESALPAITSVTATVASRCRVLDVLALTVIKGEPIINEYVYAALDLGEHVGSLAVSAPLGRHPFPLEVVDRVQSTS